MFELRRIWRGSHISKDTFIFRDLVVNKVTKKIEAIKRIVPNLIIAGAQKAGTTTLYKYLSKHPDVCMSSPEKEPGYFIFNEWSKAYFLERKGIDISSRTELLRKYMLYGYSGQKYFGDASTHYTIGDRGYKFNIPAKIKSLSPGARIVYIIRNPIDRIISLYNHIHRRENLTQEIERDASLVATSKYYYQIKPYVDAFGKNNIKILLFEDFIKDPQRALDDLFDFLGIKRMCLSSETIHANRTVSRKTPFLERTMFGQILEMLIKDIKQLEKLFEINLLQRWDLSYNNWF
ncbi:MAG: hypothetical protein GF392_03340 [Candidatus Omnitrophica bacterium]|nr:hypothetical protein [Candidatus Omnitrophota bacterium]